MIGCAGCAGTTGSDERAEELGDALSQPSRDFRVTFSHCAEFAGIGFVPAANARPLVPAHYTLAGAAANAVIVVRVSSCSNAVVDGKAIGATLVSQVGISVTGQDTSADINNYTLFYSTNQPCLQAAFDSQGVHADLAGLIGLELSPEGALKVKSRSPHTPAFRIEGTASAPTADPVPFVASWWADGTRGVVQARTEFPAIRFGTSAMTLTTPAGSALAQLAGSTTLTFALLDSYNTFAESHMVVSDTD